MTPRIRLLAGLAVMGPVLAGCALSERMRELGQVIEFSGESVQQQHEQFAAGLTSTTARKAAQQVDQPWLIGRAQPLAREVTLPVALRARVNTTLLFSDGPMTLPVLAQRITSATGIPVYVRPDALLEPTRFLPRLTGGDERVDGTREPVRVTLSGQPEPLARMLDRVSAQFGIHWRYQAQRIEFFRTETRVFNVRALTLNANAQASLGLAGQGQDSQGFVSTSSTRLDSGSHDVMQTLRARLEPFMTRAGVLVAEPGSNGSVVVTDTPDVLQRIEAYLESENRTFTRRVRLVFEEVTVLTRDTAEAGIDWNVVFASARVAAGLAVTGSVVAEAGALAVGVNEGPFKGTEAVIKALSQVGQVVRRSSLPVVTLNRRPVTHAVRTTFSYIDRIETTSVAQAGGLALPAVAVSQKDETVGSMITLVPDAQENGQVLLSVAYDNTVAQPLKSVTFGDRSNPLQLQQITIDGNGTVQQVALQPGQPLLISGFDRTEHETEGRRLNPALPLALGGSDRAASQTLTTVMIVTAQVEEGF